MPPLLAAHGSGVVLAEEGTLTFLTSGHLELSHYAQQRACERVCAPARHATTRSSAAAPSTRGCSTSTHREVQGARRPVRALRAGDRGRGRAACGDALASRVARGFRPSNISRASNERTSSLAAAAAAT